MLVLRHKKSAAVQQRFASVYGSKKATYTLGSAAVAFLMLSFLTGLHPKRFHRNLRRNLFMLVFTQLILKMFWIKLWLRLL